MLDVSLFKKGDKVAVGLSGGKDSVCLLHLLIKNCKNLGIEVLAINVEHGIRGESSLADSQFARDFCASFNVPIKCYSVNSPSYALKNGISEETSSRILRYQCFDDAIKSGFCNKIATAHHAGDNAETVLMNLFRGSALSGMGGIRPVSKNGTLVRPLSGVSRAEIDDYIKENNLPFVHDATNDDNSYTRNFIRNEVMPLISSRFEGAERAINRFSQIALREDELLNSLADDLIYENSVRFTDEKHSPLFYRACLKVIKNLGFIKDFESCHLLALENLKNNQTGAKILLKNNIIAYRSYDSVVFERNAEDLLKGLSSLEVPFKMGKIEFSDYILTFEREEKDYKKCQKKDGVLYFDLDKLPKGAIVRTKRSGDSIVTFGGREKSLKKYLTDKKIPAYISKGLPILAYENRVYIVPGTDISGLLKITDESKNIIKLTFNKKGE